jgi:antirestriction protein ArdC
MADLAGANARYRHNGHWTGAPQRLNRETLNNSHGFGDTEYAKEELRAELASVFLMAERGIPHNPDTHASYVGSWVKSLRDDKYEIFRAARDAHKAADLLIALEHHKSLDQALAHISKHELFVGQHATSADSHVPREEIIQSEMEMEL